MLNDLNLGIQAVAVDKKVNNVIKVNDTLDAVQFCLCLVSFLVIFYASTLIATKIFESWYGIIPGVVLVIFALLIHALAKEKQKIYIAAISLNAIAGGFSVSAYYLVTEESITVGNSALTLAICLTSLSLPMIIGLVFFAFKRIFKKQRLQNIAYLITTVILLVMLIASLQLWISGEKPFEGYVFAMAFFTFLLSLIFCVTYAFMYKRKNEHLLRFMSYASFGAYILITVIVVVVISQGEALEGLSGDAGGSKKKKK